MQAAGRPRARPTIGLVHWKAAEAGERLDRLRSAGLRATPLAPDGPAALRALRDRPPQAVVIDLSRLPAHGREMGMALRQSPATRHVPIVFVNGDPPRVERIRTLLPDALFTTWERIGAMARRVGRGGAGRL